MSDKKRYAIVIMISIALNMGLYCLAHFFHLPVWLDMTGTGLAAFTLEPAAGMVVGLIQSFMESIFFYDVSSIVYFAVSASVVLVVGCFLRKDGRFDCRRVPIALLMLLFTTSAISTLLTLWRTGGVPQSPWELHFYDMALASGAPPVWATFFGVMVLKAGDTAVSFLIGTVLYALLPKALKRTGKSSVYDGGNPDAKLSHP